MSEGIDKYLSAAGLKFPENLTELAAFNEAHNDYAVTNKEETIDPCRIIEEVKKEKKEYLKKPTNVDYHKRTVLASEIIYYLKEDRHMGHLKLQKLLFLCQNASKMSLHMNFLRQAMGPYDPVLMRSIDIQLKKRNWFEYDKNGFPKYKPLSKCGEHKHWFQRYFSVELEKINSLLEIFKIFNGNQIELVATIYACWMKAIETNAIINDNYFIHGVYNWDKSKRDKFTEEQIVNAVRWMKEKGVYPSE